MQIQANTWEAPPICLKAPEQQIDGGHQTEGQCHATTNNGPTGLLEGEAGTPIRLHASGSDDYQKPATVG